MSDNSDEVRVSFRLGSGSLDPAEVTLLLGIEPSHSHRAGERRAVKRRRRVGKPITYKLGVWLFDSQMPTNALVKEHLVWLLDRIEPSAMEIARLIDAGVGADFFVMLRLQSGQFGFELSPDVLHRVANLGAELGVIT